MNITKFLRSTDFRKKLFSKLRMDNRWYQCQHWPIIRQDRSTLNRFFDYEYLRSSLGLMLPCMKMILISLRCGWIKCLTQQNLIYCRRVLAVKQINVSKFSISQTWDWEIFRSWNSLFSYSLAILECMSLTPSTHLMFIMFTSPVFDDSTTNPIIRINVN